MPGGSAVARGAEAGQPNKTWQRSIAAAGIYGDVSWNFLSDGMGGTNFVITSASAGNITNGWSYQAGNPGSLANTSNVARSPVYMLSNPMHSIPVTTNDFVVYHGEGPSSYQMANSDIDFAMSGLDLNSGSMEGWSLPPDFVLDDTGAVVVGVATMPAPMFM